MEIRLIKNGEELQVHNLIKLTCQTTWVNYYPQGSIDYVVNEDLSIEQLKKKIAGAHFYVAAERNKLIGCGGIKLSRGSLEESKIFTFFVLPKYQGKGIGKLIIKTLENDEFAKRSKRIEVPSSIPGLPFYKKCGYEHKDGILNYGDGQFILEKFLDGI